MFRNKSFISKDTAEAFDILLSSLIHNLEVRYHESFPESGKVHFEIPHYHRNC